MLKESAYENIIRGVFNGSISVFELPVSLYTYTCKELNRSLLGGFGLTPKSKPIGSIREQEKFYLYRQNLGRFSGVKTWSEINTLTAAVFNESGEKRSFKDFKTLAKGVNEQYNTQWLATEQNTIVAQSQNARQWLQIEEEAEIFPILEYQTVGDDRVRDDHAALDGITRPYDDPIWDSIMPQNDFGCRCIVLQHTPDKVVTSADEARAMASEQMKHFKVHPEFKYNPGKVDFIFKEDGSGSHGYFSEIPREFSDDLRNNFGLPPIEEVL